ncbi:MAG: carboxymuconolactone decarboxylase family protein [Chloroflexi bacterium]|nr:carboxymuconolactone decarboxylase family protein [Chloroflexota bacterium]
MDEKTKELIAIGASVSAHCQPCLAYHLGKVRELGITDDEIQSAIEIGFMVEMSARSAMRKQAGEIMSKPQTQSEPCCSGGSGCCG